MRLRNLMMGIAGASVAVASHAQPSNPRDEAAARAACGVCAGFMFAIPIVYVAIAIIIAVWIYKDAQRRGDPQAGIWALVGFLFTFVGLIVYIVVRNQNQNRTNPPVPPPPPSPPVV